jgi:hypothetical protein
MAYGANLQFGKRLSKIEMAESGPVAYFEDGTSEAGTILVGADGNASFVRKWLLGDAAEPQTLPYAFMNFPVTYTAEQARYLDKTMHPIVDVGIHPKNMYIGFFQLDKPDLERPETWIFYILASWPIATKADEENTGDRLQRLRDRMDDWADPFKSAVAWVPDGTEIKPDKLKVWVPCPWDNHGGRVTIAGDAAHSMTFREFSNSRHGLFTRGLQFTNQASDRGQGGNNALKDSERFVNACLAIQKGELPMKEAIDKYDEDVYTRGKTEVEMSTMQTHVTHDHANFLNPDKSPVVKHGIKPTAR